MDQRYINDYGLINAKEADINAENSPLWSLQYILLMRSDKAQEAALDKYIDLCRTDVAGLYNQSPITHGNKDDAMSPDQLLAFACFDAYINKYNRTSAVWKYLTTHFMTYDNVSKQTNFQRIMQPIASAAVSVASKSLSSLFFRLVLSVSCIVACWSSPDKTSGKLKAWVAMKSLDMKLTKFICDLIIAKRCVFKTWEGVFCEYFQEKECPIREIIANGEADL